MIRSFLYQAGSTRTARDLSIAMLDTMISEQSDDGCWPTLSGSTWLESEYGIGAGFFDTRFNTEFAGLLLLAEYRFPSDIYRDSLRRYCGFIKDFAENYHSETGLGGWFIPDYWHEGMSSVSHTSLNHQLAEILFLYRASDALADEYALDGIYAKFHNAEKTRPYIYYRVGDTGWILDRDALASDIAAALVKALHVAGRSQQFDLLSFHQDQPPIRAA